MKQNPLIVLEGGDGSGKTTQAKLLRDRMDHEGVPVSEFSFPQYETSRAGKLIGRCLDGEHGDFLHLSPYLASLPFTLDRASARAQLHDALSSRAVLCNRYTPSNIAHQVAKLPRREWDEFISFLEEMEYEELGLPQPSAIIYLWVPAEQAAELVSKKAERPYLKQVGTTKDQYERDTTYQQHVIDAYLTLSDEYENWHVISCVDEQGTLRSPEDIHELVWEKVQTTL